MNEETGKLFNYKGKDIVVKQVDKGFYIGIKGKTTIWFESILYNSFKLVSTSGREYARNMIDKMLVARRRERHNE